MRKRLAASIGIAVALLSMSACRSSPEVAAYVGNTAITEQRVSEVENGTIVALDDKGAKSEPIKRNLVVETMVLLHACEDERAKRPFERNEVTPAELVAAEGGLPAETAPEDPAQKQRWTDEMAGTEFVALRSQAFSCLSGLPTTPGTPTEAELREIYDNAVAAGALNPSITFEQVAPQILNDQTISGWLAVKRSLDKVIAESDVTLNPRYGELPFVLLPIDREGNPAIAVSLGLPNEVVQER